MDWLNRETRRIFSEPELHDRLILHCVTLLCAVGLAALTYWGTMGALFFTGFMLSAVMPSRDPMVRIVTPPGSTGKAFGYVSSGLGVGGALGPLIYGTMLDLSLPQIIFFVAAGMTIAAIAVALLASYVARRARARRSPRAPASSPTCQPRPSSTTAQRLSTC